MQIYQDLNEAHKIKVQRWGVLLLALANVFLAVLIVNYLASLWLEAKNISGTTRKLEISVTGEGKVAAEKSDVVAEISVSVLTEKTSLSDAQAENSKKTNAVVDYLKKQGIENKDIKTTGYNIYPQYSYPRPCYGVTCPLETAKPRIIGYQVTTTYGITIRDTLKAGDILAGVVAAGANEVSGISFTIDKPDELKAKARTKAIEDARTKAEKLAKDLSKRIGRMVAFSESGTFPPIYYKQSVALESGVGAAAPASPSIETGENEIVANVTITYEFK